MILDRRYARIVSIGDSTNISIQTRVIRWPTWAESLKQLATPSDKGIGDVVARTVGPQGSQAFNDWLQETFGKTCMGGCIDRLNKQYPLTPDNR